MALPKAFATLGLLLGGASLAFVFVLSFFSLGALVRRAKHCCCCCQADAALLAQAPLRVQLGAYTAGWGRSARPQPSPRRSHHHAAAAHGPRHAPTHRCTAGCPS